MAELLDEMRGFQRVPQCYPGRSVKRVQNEKSVAPLEEECGSLNDRSSASSGRECGRVCRLQRAFEPWSLASRAGGCGLRRSAAMEIRWRSLSGRNSLM